MQESTKCTPAALIFGRELRTPVDLVFGPPPEQEVRGEPGLDYYYHLCERLRVVHELARQSLAESGVQQKRAYDLRTKGEDFVAGVGLQPSAEKGTFPQARQSLGGALHHPEETVRCCVAGGSCCGGVGWWFFTGTGWDLTDHWPQPQSILRRGNCLFHHPVPDRLLEVALGLPHVGGAGFHCTFRTLLLIHGLLRTANPGG